jgi:NAD(P)-dependent dehydrogenase (short-subunit alcohol dehydrogenase family)
MSNVTTASFIRRQPELLGHIVVVTGGSAGIGLETARQARAEGANLIMTARNSERLQHAVPAASGSAGGFCDQASTFSSTRVPSRGIYGNQTQRSEIGGKSESRISRE